MRNIQPLVPQWQLKRNAHPIALQLLPIRRWKSRVLLYWLRLDCYPLCAKVSVATQSLKSLFWKCAYVYEGRFEVGLKEAAQYRVGVSDKKHFMPEPQSFQNSAIHIPFLFLPSIIRHRILRQLKRWQTWVERLYLQSCKFSKCWSRFLPRHPGYREVIKPILGSRSRLFHQTFPLNTHSFLLMQKVKHE